MGWFEDISGANLFSGIMARITGHSERPLGLLPSVSYEAPTIDDPAAIAAKTEERERLRRTKGRRSTILTGPGGLAGAGPLQRKTLLGQ